MYKIGEYVVYKKDVCKIKEIKKNYIDNKDYYVLNLIIDDSLKIKIPTDAIDDLRYVISKKEALELINEIPNIEPININDKMVENIYRNLLLSGNLKDLIKIIKTAYLRNEERLQNKRKIGEIDDSYFKKAEKLLYTELSISLDMNYDKTKDFVVNKVKKIENE